MGPKRGRPSGKNDHEPTSGKKKVKQEVDYTLYQDIANWLRIDEVRAVHVTKSGHPTSGASIADILSVLFFHQNGMKFHAKNTSHFLNDRIVLSKGHACPALYAAFYRAGIITQQNLLSLRLKDSLIEGHPVPKIPFVDIATGSLGQGLSVACGMAYSSKHFDKIDNTIYCITGDGQIAQGSIWQAADFARNYNLDNLITFVDVNALGQSQQTMHQHHTEVIKGKFAAFGWQAIQIDGHSFSDIINTLAKIKASKNGKPKAIIARTQKGKGFNGQIQGKLDWHGKDLGKFTEQVITRLKQSIKTENIQFKTYAPEGDEPVVEKGVVSIKPNYEKGSIISTRKAYGNGLTKARQSNPNVVGLDGDTKNSTFTITLKNKFPESFVQCFIAQQNMVGVTQGLACRRKIPFCATFACFLIRAADQIRIGGISGNTLKCVGSHSGCSIGQDGPSQMALQDLAFFRTLPKGIVLVPSDGVSTQKAVELVANYNDGPSFIRTGRPDVKVLYDNNQIFQLGKCKVPFSSQNDQISLVSVGVTVHQCLKAAQTLKSEGINARVIDIFSLKPLDVQGLKANIEKTSGNVIVVQEHYPQGGLYDAVCASVLASIKKVVHLCVRKVPGSAKPEQQLQIHGLDHESIAKNAKELLKN